MTIGEVGAWVCSHLQKRGIRVVLTGGACVSIFSDNAYLSNDLDFIEEIPAGPRKLRKVLKEIGFEREKRHYIHPDTLFFLEFPPGPLSIGEEHISQVIELEFDTGKLRLLSPTDCVKDRLAAFYHWDDRQSLHQALLVASNQEIDLPDVRHWSEKEGQNEKFERFFQELMKQEKNV
jgi:hypothetical protein